MLLKQEKHIENTYISADKIYFHRNRYEKAKHRGILLNLNNGGGVQLDTVGAVGKNICNVWQNLASFCFTIYLTTYLHIRYTFIS